MTNGKENDMKYEGKGRRKLPRSIRHGEEEYVIDFASAQSKASR